MNRRALLCGAAAAAAASPSDTVRVACVGLRGRGRMFTRAYRAPYVVPERV